MTRANLFMVLAGASLVAIVSTSWIVSAMSKVEEPAYAIVAIEGPAEIRAYGPMIVAETQVSGERSAAINEGFQLLAAYIFGANQPNTKIAMTAPVQQTSRTTTIEMTAPVMQQSTGSLWTVRFTMPGAWTLDTLPAPNDARVKLVPLPAARLLSLRFSGLASDETVRAKTEELRSVATRLGLKIAEQPTFAFYDPPWTLPFLRRNEVLFQIL
jgi:hypothetical protein